MNRLLRKILFANPVSRRKDCQGGQGGQGGQGLVEFALILPMLLVLLLGIIEVGRLLVINSSLEAASREAARYGAASGRPSGVSKPYYYDNVGIRSAAKRVAVLIGLTDANIVISYDHGPGSSAFTPNTNDENAVTLGDRLIVTVNGSYKPLFGLTAIRPFTIRSVARRTIVKDVEVSGASGGSNGYGQGNGNSNSKPTVHIITPDDDTWHTLGHTINFSATATDPDDGDISDQIRWYSDGQLIGIGADFPFASLSAGTHFILAQANDSFGNWGADSITVHISDVPIISISSPNGGVFFEAGEAIFFQGSATGQGGNLSASIKWTDNLNGNLFTGASFSRTNLSPGLHTVTATVTDSNGQSASATVSFTVLANNPPQLIVILPIDQSTFGLGAVISFQATASDTLDGDLTSVITWKDGATTIGTGGSFSLSNLTEGDHTIVASVKDSANQTVTVTRIIHISSKQSPTIVITAPANNASFEVNKPVKFTGVATKKPENTNISANIKWYVDGSSVASATGANFTISTLVMGIHTIRAEITDVNNLTANAIVTVEIVKPNTPPSIVINTITTPLPEAGFKPTKSVTANGTASDAEDGDLSASIKWFSSINGYLGQGAQFIVNPPTQSLSAGTHIITAMITDTKGLSALDTRTIDVINFICPSTEPGHAVRGNKYLTWALQVPGLTEPLDYYLTKLEITTQDSTSNLFTDVRVEGTSIKNLTNVGNTGALPTITLTAQYYQFTLAPGNVSIDFRFNLKNKVPDGMKYRFEAHIDGCGPYTATYP